MLTVLFYTAYTQSMEHSKQTVDTPNGLTQKVTGDMDWDDYMEFLDHIKKTRGGKGQMKFVGEAVVQRVARERAEREA